MTRIGIIVGSTRPNRQGAAIGRWVHQVATRRSDADFDLIDLDDIGLPLLNEPLPPALGAEPEHEHTRRWARTVDTYDGFVLVSPEYNHSVPAALKNALDFLFAEWNNKAVGMVTYGSAGGVRAGEHLRQIVGELKMADVRAQVTLQFGADFDEHWQFRPREFQAQMLHGMLDELVAWSEALANVRAVRQSA
jgi:NAD(P)H-dependent FMN reductase